MIKILFSIITLFVFTSFASHSKCEFSTKDLSEKDIQIANFFKSIKGTRFKYNTDTCIRKIKTTGPKLNCSLFGKYKGQKVTVLTSPKFKINLGTKRSKITFSKGFGRGATKVSDIFYEDSKKVRIEKNVFEYNSTGARYFNNVVIVKDSNDFITEIHIAKLEKFSDGSVKAIRKHSCR